MADFEDIILDENKLIKAFEKLSVTDAMLVKSNLDAAIPHLKSISPELAQMLEKEGISLSDISGERKPRKKRQVIAENQKYCKIDGQLQLLITRAITKAEKDGHEILDFQSLKGADVKEAKRLVDEYNA